MIMSKGIYKLMCDRMEEVAVVRYSRRRQWKEAEKSCSWQWQEAGKREVAVGSVQWQVLKVVESRMWRQD